MHVFVCQFQHPFACLCHVLARRHRMLRKLRIQGRRRQGKFSQFFFLWFSWKMHFSKYVLVKKKPEQAMHIGVGSGHICSKHKKLSLFLISGHGTQNAVGMRCLAAFCLNRACFPHLKRNFVLFLDIIYIYINIYIYI